MAKNHVLPRYLLWLAVCVCVVLGSGVLGSYRQSAVKYQLGQGNRTQITRILCVSQPRTLGRIEIVEQIDTDFLAVGSLHDDTTSCQMETVDQRLSVESASSAFNPSFKPLREIYLAEIGVREATGGNDGPRVAEYLRYCGLGEGYAWCAAFVSWCHGQTGYAEPRNAWSPALFPQKRIIWTKDTNGAEQIPRAGDVFGIYYANLRRIAHVGFVDGWDNKYCITVEGNTGPDGIIDENGDPANPIRAGPSREGVYRKRRPVMTIYAVSRWTQ